MHFNLLKLIFYLARGVDIKYSDVLLRVDCTKVTKVNKDVGRCLAVNSTPSRALYLKYSKDKAKYWILIG